MAAPKSSFQSVFIDLRQGVASALLMLALAMQALVPGGYMVGANPANGAVAITLCSSNGMISAYIDANGQVTQTDPASHNPASDEDGTSSVCNFVGHGAAASVANQQALNGQSLTFEALANDRLSISLVSGLRLAAPPPPKTGPPIQA